MADRANPSRKRESLTPRVEDVELDVPRSRGSWGKADQELEFMELALAQSGRPNRNATLRERIGSKLRRGSLLKKDDPQKANGKPSGGSQPSLEDAEEHFEWFEGIPNREDGDEQDDDDDVCFPFWHHLPTRGRWILVDFVGLVIFGIIGLVSKFAFADRAEIATVKLSLWALFIAVTIVSLSVCRLVVWAVVKIWERGLSVKRGSRMAEVVELVDALQTWIAVALWSILNYGLWIWILLTQVCPGTGDCQRNPVTSIFLGLMVSGIAFFLKSFIFHRFVRAFHRDAYADRLAKLKYAEYVLDKLQQARKRARKVSGHVKTPEYFVETVTPPERIAIEPLADKTLNGLQFSSDGPSIGQESHTTEESPHDPHIAKLLSPSDSRHLHAASRVSTEPSPAVPTSLARPTAARSVTESTTPSKAGAILQTLMPPFVQGFLPRSADDDVESIDEGSGSKSEQLLAEQAALFAKKIFEWLCPDGREELKVEDFSPVFSKLSTAKKAFDFFDRNGNGSISKREMRMTVTEVYEERRNLTDSISDMHRALGKLNGVLIVLAVFLLFWIWLLIFGIDLASVFVTLTSLVVLSTYFIGGTLKDSFTCIIFLFVVHPYDVGDRVMLPDQPLGLQVMKMDILTTTFRRIDGMSVNVSNTVLSNAYISNLRRSAPMEHTVTLHIPIDTDMEKVTQLELKMNEWVQTELVDFSSFRADVIDMVGETYSMRLWLRLKHRDNWQDSQKRFSRQSKFIKQLKTLLQQFDMQPVSWSTNYHQLNLGPELKKMAEDGLASGRPRAPPLTPP